MFKSFNGSLILTSTFLLACSWVVLEYFLLMPKLYVVYLIVGYMALLTWFVHNWLVKSIAKRPAQFVASFIGAISLKMLLSILVVGLLAYFNRPSIKIIGVSFIVYYFTYTALNIKFLLKENK
jgi:hypothetical protein